MFNISNIVHNLITNLAEILDLSNLMGGKRIWMPVPDNEFTSESFLPGKPEQLLIDGQININEVLIGTNADEGPVHLYHLDSFDRAALLAAHALYPSACLSEG